MREAGELCRNELLQRAGKYLKAACLALSLDNIPLATTIYSL